MKDDSVLFNSEKNLLENVSWIKRGYINSALFRPKDYKQLKSIVTGIVAHSIESEGISCPDFKLDQYHKYVNTDRLHMKILKKMGYIHKTSELGLLNDLIAERVKTLLKIKDYEISNYNTYHIRIIRPNSNDNNPLHKDIWINRLRNAINLYIPIAGSNRKSSLKVVPGSHLWKESNIEKTHGGALIRGIKYTVPAVSKIKKKKYKIIRPNPKEGDVLIFTPYMIHGGAENLNKNMTRVSIEMRFWTKD